MKTSYVIAVVLAVGAAAWIVSGQIGEGQRTAEAQKPPADLSETKQIASVRVRRQEADRHVTELTLRGRTEADRTVDVRAETSGRVIELTVDKGDRVKAGQVIARLDDKGRSAALREAKALLAQRKIEFEAADRLSEKGFRAATQVAAAQAALDGAEASVRLAQVEIENTVITAPFDGIVDDRMIELGDFLEIGNEIARIVDLDPILVVAQVNEQDIGLIRPGTNGRARLITGEELTGEVAFVASMADQQTRTFRIDLEVANPNGALPDGVSAELTLPTGDDTAHWVSPSVLTLSDDGLVGVKVVDDESRVRFLPARVVEFRSDGVWLGGLPQVISLITVGHEFVKDGQEVRPIEEPVQAAEGSAS